ncbi:MAG: hypothetical protein IJI20_04710 [Firmicutes bacterium]|nr:hypothetical protein [Bacillota bacterium]
MMTALRRRSSSAFWRIWGRPSSRSARSLPIVGCAGYVVSVVFAFFLYRDIKKDK